MSDATAPMPLQPAGEAGASAGAVLRRLRQNAGLEQAALASMLKVSVRRLEALESNRLDELPDLIFARGMAASICRTLGADPHPVLDRMPELTSELQPLGPGLNEPFRAAGERPPLFSAISGPLMVAVAVLLLAAALIWLWPAQPGQPADAAGSATVGEAGTAGTSVPAVQPQPGVNAQAMAVVVQPPLVPSQASETPQPAAMPRPADALLFSATAESWVSVRDADDASLLNRTLQAGDTVTVNGKAPLAVTIGRKEAVSVTVHGQPFDHRSLSPSSVARFEVK